MGRDVAAITEKIRRVTGHAPRVWVWPYGAEGGSTLRIAGEHGYQLALTLEDGAGRLSRLMSTPRLLLSSDPALKPFANSVVGMEANPFMRVAHVDLDYVYDPDPAQTDRNLGVCGSRRRRPGEVGVLPQPLAAHARRPVQPRSLAIAQPRQRDGLRLDASAGL
ncbi:hypothetical protein G6F40_014802 [Rhizopus arrhizus]|nr:hypothetical protein G6F40_014802 [Rhizopus arrhizus]